VVAIAALFIVMVWASYVFYLPFEGWWTLRFLLPAFPAFCVLACVGLFRAAAGLPSASRGPAVAAVLALVLWWSLGFVGASHALDSSDEWRFATMGREVARQVPRESVVLAFLHSGSVRYYADRLTMRWDRIEPSQLDGAVAHLQQRGYTTFILLDKADEEAFRTRFAGASRLAALDWQPQVTVPGVALYRVP
jgi:hypothetical protein